MTDAETGATESLTWPSALPAPTIDDATAVYPNLIDGVDLRVTVTPQGAVSEVLVVKNATAAANPALNQLRLATQSSGLTLSTDSADDINGISGGVQILHSPTPLMWDSAGSTSAASAEVAPAAGASVARVGTALSGASVLLTPNQSMLDSSSTVFPVYIDPTIAWNSKYGTDNGWDWAQEAFPTSSWWENTSNGDPSIGYQGWTPGTYGRNRSFYQYDIGALTNSTLYDIHSASVFATQTWSGDNTCANTYRIDAYSTGHISTATTWNNQPNSGVLGNWTLQSYANLGSCIGVTGSWNVLNAVNTDADGIITVAFVAHDESSKWYYKRFDVGSTGPGSSGKGTYLTINYDSRPTQPTPPTLNP